MGTRREDRTDSAGRVDDRGQLTLTEIAAVGDRRPTPHRPQETQPPTPPSARTAPPAGPGPRYCSGSV